MVHRRLRLVLLPTLPSLLGLFVACGDSSVAIAPGVDASSPPCTTCVTSRDAAGADVMHDASADAVDPPDAPDDASADADVEVDSGPVPGTWGGSCGSGCGSVDGLALECWQTHTGAPHDLFGTCVLSCVPQDPPSLAQLEMECTKLGSACSTSEVVTTPLCYAGGP